MKVVAVAMFAFSIMAVAASGAIACPSAGKTVKLETTVAGGPQSTPILPKPARPADQS